MMETAQLIHVCNHLVEELNSNFVTETVVRSSTDQFDIVCPGYIINNVYCIHTADAQGNMTYYYEKYDFNKYTTDKIIWLPEGRKPANGAQYTIEYLKTTRSIIQYKQEDCTKCDGNGWYVDFVTTSGASVGKVQGEDKIIQDFIKILLTYSDDGTDDLFSYIGKGSYSDTSERISDYIRKCESKYLTRQADMIANGFPVDDSEILKKVLIKEVDFDEELGGYYLSIVLVTNNGTKNTVSLKI